MFKLYRTVRQRHQALHPAVDSEGERERERERERESEKARARESEGCVPRDWYISNNPTFNTTPF